MANEVQLTDSDRAVVAATGIGEAEFKAARLEEIRERERRGRPQERDAEGLSETDREVLRRVPVSKEAFLRARDGQTPR